LQIALSGKSIKQSFLGFMPMTDLWKPLLALALCGVGVAGMLSARPIVRADGVLVPHEPLQTPTQAAPFHIGDYELTPRARYEIEARVLGVEPYSMDDGARLSPLDFAVGWGAMSDSAVLSHFRITQGARFFTIYPDERALDIETALRSVANMHLIPASAELRRQLERVRPGQVVQLSGQLVNVSGPNDYAWRTSLTRTDTGAGACELFYVESLRLR
jgi:hypothetical protein